MPCMDNCSPRDLELAEIQINELTGMLGALCTRLTNITRENDVTSIFLDATKEGQCDDILFWYNRHINQDKVRMRKKLANFSVDELNLIVSMLKAGEL